MATDMPRPEEVARDERILGYCENCGDALWSHVPFHCCSIHPATLSPMNPFCAQCGGTLREGFIQNRTCQCKGDDA